VVVLIQKGSSFKTIWAPYRRTACRFVSAADGLHSTRKINVQTRQRSESKRYAAVAVVSSKISINQIKNTFNSGFQVIITILRRVLQVVANFQRFTCEFRHGPIKCKPLMHMYNVK
jgi:hypothetical protein